ncbi:hypothetical protein SMC26_33040 [Actinomadura fulvescens]|uniref:DUF6879 domain-containing protein n=1 Tax=Actinomadura fulvescens TaxID=46160 RepID=A0ABP6CJG1_9ACTN
MGETPSPVELLQGARQTAYHLEMRDGYMRSDPWYQAWARGDTAEFEARLERPWLDLIREVTGRGVQVRRVRIVSEPVSDYIRFEHATTASNVAAGEEIRWLPRRRASDLALPGNDCWIVDGEAVLFHHFTGEGELATDAREFITAPSIVKLCESAFDAAWDRAIDHRDYQI